MYAYAQRVQCTDTQSGTGTSVHVHTYVYTCLSTSGRSAEPRLVFGPQHPTTLLRFLPSAPFFLRWQSRMMPALRTEKSLHGRYVILVSQDRRGPPFTDSTAMTQDRASIPPARRHSMGTRHTLMPPWSRSYMGTQDGASRRTHRKVLARTTRVTPESIKQARSPRAVCGLLSDRSLSNKLCSHRC